jgi:hypothetical protein
MQFGDWPVDPVLVELLDLLLLGALLEHPPEDVPIEQVVLGGVAVLLFFVPRRLADVAAFDQHEEDLEQCLQGQASTEYRRHVCHYLCCDCQLGPHLPPFHTPSFPLPPFPLRFVPISRLSLDYVDR